MRQESGCCCKLSAETNCRFCFRSSCFGSSRFDRSNYTAHYRSRRRSFGCQSALALCLLWLVQIRFSLTISRVLVEMNLAHTTVLWYGKFWKSLQPHWQPQIGPLDQDPQGRNSSVVTRSEYIYTCWRTGPANLEKCNGDWRSPLLLLLHIT